MEERTYSVLCDYLKDLLSVYDLVGIKKDGERYLNLEYLVCKLSQCEKLPKEDVSIKGKEK